MERIFEGRTVCCIATGPTLAAGQIETARVKGFALAGCNNTWELAPDLAVLYGCNWNWWNHYWCDALARHPAQKWTANRQAAEKFGLHWIAERGQRGLSRDPSVIHHGHGSGYSLLNLVYLMGASRIVLLGYTLKYAPDYNGGAKRIGDGGPRHYFGEYPKALQHWPKKEVVDGVHVGLLELYRSVARQKPVEIIDCSAGALDCFPKMDIAEV